MRARAWRPQYRGTLSCRGATRVAALRRRGEMQRMSPRAAIHQRRIRQNGNSGRAPCEAALRLGPLRRHQDRCSPTVSTGCRGIATIAPDAGTVSTQPRLVSPRSLWGVQSAGPAQCRADRAVYAQRQPDQSARCGRNIIPGSTRSKMHLAVTACACRARRAGAASAPRTAYCGL